MTRSQEAHQQKNRKNRLPKLRRGLAVLAGSAAVAAMAPAVAEAKPLSPSQQVQRAIKIMGNRTLVTFNKMRATGEGKTRRSKTATDHLPQLEIVEKVTDREDGLTTYRIMSAFHTRNSKNGKKGEIDPRGANWTYIKVTRDPDGPKGPAHTSDVYEGEMGETDAALGKKATDNTATYGGYYVTVNYRSGLGQRAAYEETSPGSAYPFNADEFSVIKDGMTHEWHRFKAGRSADWPYFDPSGNDGSQYMLHKPVGNSTPDYAARPAGAHEFLLR